VFAEGFGMQNAPLCMRNAPNNKQQKAEGSETWHVAKKRNNLTLNQHGRSVTHFTTLSQRPGIFKRPERILVS